MSVAICLVAYAAVLTWLGPPVLQRMTRQGVSPRLGVAAWLTAIAAAVTAWILALAVLVLSTLASVTSGTVLKVCLGALGLAERIAVSPWAAALVVLPVVAVALPMTGLAGRRVIAGLRRQQRSSREHASAARIIGYTVDHADVVVVSASQPTAYCVDGRPPTIVITTAALDSLDEAELAAVLAHERAHIRGRHPQLLMALRALARALPGLPLFAAGVDAVARLLEMCADDAAVRRHGSHALLCGLATLVGRPAAVAGALGAADAAVLERAARLAQPLSSGNRWRERVRLTLLIGLAIVAPMVAVLLCQH